MRVEQLDYELPHELVAQAPCAEREAARLLQLDRRTGAVLHRRVRDFAELLPARSLLVLNDTRVLSARLLGRKLTGGRVELLVIEPALGGEPHVFRCMARPAKGLRAGTLLLFEGVKGRVLGRDARGYVLVAFEAEGDVLAALEKAGRMPLPPYIARSADDTDRTRYQTVYARHAGAVAAPTAGLHFSRELLFAIEAAGHELAYLTLHVGPGTFAPLRVDDLDLHPMHEERFWIEPHTVDQLRAAQDQGRKVVAVGTTVVRALEANVAQHGELRPGPGRTRLLIQPPFTFRVVDGLLTNFHLPRSTLLALVMAFAGESRVRAAYAEAVRARYRFFSYGDAMWIPPAATSAP